MASLLVVRPGMLTTVQDLGRWGCQNSGVPVAALIAFVPVVAMAQVMPISLSGLGIREGMLVLLLHPLGISTGHAVGLGLGWYATMLIVSLLGAPAFAIGHRTATAPVSSNTP